jgi:hypothetical protein
MIARRSAGDLSMEGVMSEENLRRRFLKTALVSAGAAAGLFGTVKFNAADGIKIGKSSVKVGVSEANAVCGVGVGCSGGGGQCGVGVGCSGGGGQCGVGVGCGGQ